MELKSTGNYRLQQCSRDLLRNTGGEETSRDSQQKQLLRLLAARVGSLLQRYGSFALPPLQPASSTLERIVARAAGASGAVQASVYIARELREIAPS